MLFDIFQMMSEEESGSEADHPLIPMHPAKKRPFTPRTRETKIIIPKSSDLWNWDPENTDEAIVFADRKKRGTSLIANDVCFLLLWSLQLFCLLFSMGLRWPFPENFLKTIRYVFFFNLDVWEYYKLSTNGTYTSLRDYYTPTDLVGINYWNILLGWGILIFLLFIGYIITTAVIRYKHSPFMLVQIAQLQRAYMIFVQILSLPFGTTVARLFHCNANKQADIDNTISCFGGTHLALISPSIAFSLVLYGMFPAWLILKTRSEMLDMSSDRHEGYLQLRETEYVQGLDVQWTIANFHIFSSFKKYGAHLRAVMHILHAVMLILYASLFHHLFAGALLVDLILFAMFLAFVIVRPFRVSAFNVFLILSFLMLTLVGMMGVLATSFDSYSVQTIWLTPYYLNIVLIVMCGAWVAFAVVFVIYVLSRHVGCCDPCFPNNPLWPSLTSKDLYNMSPTTREYVKSIIICRMLVGQSGLALHSFSLMNILHVY